MKIIEFAFIQRYWERIGMAGVNHFFLVPGTTEFKNFGYGKYAEITEGSVFDESMVYAQHKKKNVVVLNTL